MNKTKYLLLLSFTLLILITSCATLNTETTKQISHSQKKDFSETTDYLITNLKYKTYPNYPLLDSYINSAINNQWENFKLYAKQEWENVNKLNTTPKPYEYNAQTQDFEDSDFISILITTYIYNGGPHGNYVLVSYTYDKKLNKIITIDQVCKYSIYELSEQCRGKLIQNIINYNTMTIPEINELTDYIKQGTEPNYGNFEIFTVNKNHIKIYFEPYSVAPYSYGIQSVELNK